MKKYVCSVCGYVYDEARGIPEAGIKAGTKWSELPEDWVCPLCGASKAAFKEVGGDTPPAKQVQVMEDADDIKELSSLEISALCSNLARGCEKQYKTDEMALFTELSQYFKAASAPANETDTSALLSLIEKDLENGFPSANAAASAAKDRGALRALVWSEKVTRILD
ncbi:MAG: rubredoxin, partial [Clostridia bacterium]